MRSLLFCFRHIYYLPFEYILKLAQPCTSYQQHTLLKKVPKIYTRLRFLGIICSSVVFFFQVISISTKTMQCPGPHKIYKQSCGKNMLTLYAQHLNHKLALRYILSCDKSTIYRVWEEHQTILRISDGKTLPQYVQKLSFQ